MRKLCFTGNPLFTPNPQCNMKLFCFIIAAILLESCKNEEGYQAKFIRYGDSCLFWDDRFLCNVKCGNLDSMKISHEIGHAFNDSVNKYYDLMYPNGNPADNKEEQQNDNCPCK